jgi:ankyrin repeat protein
MRASPILFAALLFLAPPLQAGTPRSPLAAAAIAGRAAEIRTLVAQGADPNAPADRGLSPLALAARAGQVEAMLALFECGAKLDLRDDGPNGWTPIMHALHKGQTEAALALLDWGADPNAPAPNGVTPLMRAACEANPTVARALLDNGADPRDMTRDRVNVLTHAVQGRNAEIVRMILEAAPDERVSDTMEGFLATFLARITGHGEVLVLLRDAERRSGSGER